MTLGLENKKKTAALGVLVLVMLYMIYTNVLSSPPVPTPAAESSRADSAAEIERAAEVSRPSAVPGAPARTAVPKARNEEFHPALRSKRQDQQQQIDPLLMDPTLHLQALSKLQEVSGGGAARNLFQFGAPPPPPSKAVKPVGPEPTIAVNQPPVTPQPMNVQPPPPPPPPFKYYGLETVRSTGAKRGYFLDGDEIVLAPEGGLLKKRYRVVRISPDSVTLEDTQLNRQQSVRISEDVNGPA